MPLAVLLFALLQAATVPPSTSAAPKPAAPAVTTGSTPYADAFAVLALYNGAWTIHGAHTMAGEGKPDHLVNHCTAHEAYFTCEQVVNGKALALIVFVPADKPGSYHTQIILPSGYATGRSDMTVDGAHWTFNGKDVEGEKTTYFRTENTFSGSDHIHFEQFESADGTTWKKTNEGDEARGTS